MSKTKNSAPPRIGQYWPTYHGVYAGTTVKNLDEPDYHIVVPDNTVHNSTYETACFAVAALGLHMPTCREMAIIGANCPLLLERTFYWSGEPCEVGAGWAWGRDMLSGAQVNAPMSTNGKARGIRRVPVTPAIVTGITTIELTAYQLEQAGDLLDAEYPDALVAIANLPARGDEPAGLYAWDAEYPEEGVFLLEPDRPATLVAADGEPDAEITATQEAA